MRAALDHLRAAGDRVVEHLLAAVALRLVDHRAEAVGLVRRVADRDGAGALGQRLHVAVVERAGDDVAAGGDAGLALVVPGGPGADHRGVVDVGVVEHHERVVAAELERAVLELAARDLGDLAAGAGGAGEVDHRDVGVGDERLADLDVARHDLEQAGGEPGRGEDLREQQAAADRRLRRGLEDDRVAEGERRGDDAHAEDQREVPWRDAADDAARDALDEALAAGRVRRDDLGRGARRERRRLEELVLRAADLVGGLAGDRAGLAHDQRGDLVGALAELRGGGAEDARAHVIGLGGPGRLRGLRGLDRGVDVLRRRDARLADRLLRRLVEHGQRRPAAGGAELAVDEDLAVPDGAVLELLHGFSSSSVQAHG